MVLSHPSVSVCIDGKEVLCKRLFSDRLHFKTVIRWRLDNVVGLCNLASQLRNLRKRGMRVSYLLFLDLNVSFYRSSIRYILKILDDPFTSVILLNLDQGIPAFLLDRINYVVEKGDRIATTFSVNDLPVRKLALLASKQLGPYLKILGLSPTETVSRETVRRQYKKMILRAHPDKGGNADEFDNINEAYDAIVAWMICQK